MIDRRELLAAGGAATILAMSAGKLSARAPSPHGLRTITYNVLACRGYNGGEAGDPVAVARVRPQIPARLALELALHEPDIVTFQESPSETVVADVARRMGMHHTYFPGGFPGAVISRFPIVASRNCPLADGERPKDLFTRHWGRAEVMTDDGAVVIHSVHLYPGEKGRERRLREVPLMLAAMKADLESGRSVILQGDLNHRPEDPEYRMWADAGLTDCFAAKGTGQPLTIPSTTPRARIDYVWCHGPISSRLRECRVLFEGAFRTNPEDASSVALSDHVPVLAVFGAPDDGKSTR